jgi:hypothetical protein
MLLLSAASGRTPPPQVYTLQLVSPQQPPAESGCVPLLLFVGVIVAAALLL